MTEQPLSGRRILLVEDEPLIAMFAEMTLGDVGAIPLGPAATVSAASSAIEGEAPEAALVDVRLRNGESGYNVADLLAARGIPFVLATGLHPGDIPEHHRARPVLSKPYTAPQLLAALAALLAPVP